MKTKMNFLTILFLLLVLSSCTCLRWNGVPAKGSITAEQADKMETLYKDNQYEILNDALNNGSPVQTIQDYREVWFDVEDIIQYISYLKDIGEDKNLENLGLRVYLGGKREGEKVFTSIFFIPTYRKVGTDPNDPESNINITDEFDDVLGYNYGNSRRPPLEFRYNRN